MTTYLTDKENGDIQFERDGNGNIEIAQTGNGRADVIVMTQEVLEKILATVKEGGA